MKNKRHGLSRSRKERIKRETGYLCQYCQNATATQVDHVDPYSYAINNRDENLAPSCRRCNAIAGSKVFKSFYEKRRYILSELSRPSSKWARKKSRPDICTECGDFFQPGVGVATVFLCERCAKVYC